MVTTISLRHTTHRIPRRVEYFYDGIAIAENGLVTIESTKREQIRAAYFRGYQMTPEGKRLNGFDELDRYIDTMTAKSAEVQTYEGNDGGRQPVDTNRVRSRKRNRG